MHRWLARSDKLLQIIEVSIGVQFPLYHQTTLIACGYYCCDVCESSVFLNNLPQYRKVLLCNRHILHLLPVDNIRDKVLKDGNSNNANQSDSRDRLKTFGSDKLIHAIDTQPTLASIPQSRDRRAFFMDLTLRRAKGFVQNKLRDLPCLGAHPGARPLVVSLRFNSLTQRRKGAKTRRVTGSDCLHNRSLNSALVFLK